MASPFKPNENFAISRAVPFEKGKKDGIQMLEYHVSVFGMRAPECEFESREPLNHVRERFQPFVDELTPDEDIWGRLAAFGERLVEELNQSFNYGGAVRYTRFELSGMGPSQEALELIFGTPSDALKH